jgi:hypothetical protein
MFPHGCSSDKGRRHAPGGFPGRVSSFNPETGIVHTYEGFDVEIKEYMDSAERACLDGNAGGCHSLAWLYGSSVGSTNEDLHGYHSDALVLRDNNQAQRWRKHACHNIKNGKACSDYAIALDSRVDRLRYRSLACQYGYGDGCFWMAKALLDTNRVNAKKLFQRACRLDGFYCSELLLDFGDELSESEYRDAMRFGCAIEPEIKARSTCREVILALVNGEHGYRKNVRMAIDVAAHVCEDLNWSDVCKLGADIMMTQENRYVNARDVALDWYEKGCPFAPEACLKFAQLHPESAAWAVSEAISHLEQSCRTDPTACFMVSRIYADLPKYLPQASPDRRKSMHFVRLACENDSAQCL